VGDAAVLGYVIALATRRSAASVWGPDEMVDGAGLVSVAIGQSHFPASSTRPIPAPLSSDRTSWFRTFFVGGVRDPPTAASVQLDPSTAMLNHDDGRQPALQLIFFTKARPVNGAAEGRADSTSSDKRRSGMRDCRRLYF